MTNILQQALEALEYHQEQTRPIEKTQKALEALRLAINVVPITDNQIDSLAEALLEITTSEVVSPESARAAPAAQPQQLLEEREACAKVCDAAYKVQEARRAMADATTLGGANHIYFMQVMEAIAACASTIRARSNS